MPKKINKKTTIADLAKTIEQLAISVNQGFGAIDKKFENIDKKLDKKPDTSEMFSWNDQQVVPIAIDVDKLKYIHLKELKNVPSAHEVSRILVKQGLKVRKK